MLSLIHKTPVKITEICVYNQPIDSLDRTCISVITKNDGNIEINADYFP